MPESIDATWVVEAAEAVSAAGQEEEEEDDDGAFERAMKPLLLQVEA